MVRVARVLPGSIAEELEIVVGTELLTVNGEEVTDFLDWEFLSAEDELLISGRDPAGGDLLYEIERSENQPLGIELEPPRIRRCANRCEFCFIEGLPTGLRSSLYVRDDDYRLSFAYGNFATLSNLRDRDYERIFRYRLSPLYVSVHATDLEARKVLLNNPRVPAIMEQLRRLAEGGIAFHCQMVIVPGLNDGAVLEQSLRDLWSLGDSVLTTAVVPVGLTQFSHLYSGKTMDSSIAGTLLDTLSPWQSRAVAERGSRWVYGSDELYILAGRELPAAHFYDDFPQIENGVGGVTWLRRRVLEDAGELRPIGPLRIGIVTGTSMATLMPELVKKLEQHTGAQFEIIPRENSLFGPTTTVAGLLVGRDMVESLRDRGDLDLALIPAESINDSAVFLDDMTLEELRREVPVSVQPSYDFLDVLTDWDGLQAVRK